MATRRAKHQPLCGEVDCTEPAEVEWKDDHRNSDTWFYKDCEVCEQYYCEAHAEALLEWDEERELRVCIDCTATEMRRVAKKGETS
jgi:hypothetical protein